MKNTLLCSAIGIMILTVGCTVSRQPAAARTSHLLTDQPDTQPKATVATCLRVRSVRAESPFGGTALLYRTGKTGFEKDYYNQFMTAPDKQIGQLLAARLKAAGISICSDGGPGPKRLTLEPHLEGLYADFTDPQSPFAFVKMRVVLTQHDRSCRCGSIVFDERFEATASLTPKPTADAVVEAMSAAIGDVLQRAIERIE